MSKVIILEMILNQMILELFCVQYLDVQCFFVNKITPSFFFGYKFYDLFMFGFYILFSSDMRILLILKWWKKMILAIAQFLYMVT